MFGPVILSDVLGYASIGSWLGAQFPQVIENIRRESADGLALPFLLNWAAGDATNLLGCILTHQLPFQTWLAAYFCFVDFSLLLQFFYYRVKNQTKPPHYLAARSRTTSTMTRRMSIEREATHYRALSNVAANVAAAAAIAAEQEEQARWGRSSLDRAPYSAIESREVQDDEDDAVPEEALSRLADSFHSDSGRTGRPKKVSWSQERRGGSLGRTSHSTLSPSVRMHTSLQFTMPGAVEEADVHPRGRSLAREVSLEVDDEEWTASRRRSSRASRKGASMVFLGIWALFGIGAFTRIQPGLLSYDRPKSGRVLALDVGADITPNNVELIHPILQDVGSLYQGPSMTLLPRASEAPEYSKTMTQTEHSTEFIIGRISAWICTTLYLTSRLPQIWKNFVRKSVEGLSMYLFIFAFLGNLFYVASILTSPKLSLPPEEATAFIKESIPYLLGSGGTLVFDVTIVTQSFLYKPRAFGRSRRGSRSINEEEEGLLSAGATGAEEAVTPSRRRTGTSANPAADTN